MSRGGFSMAGPEALRQNVQTVPGIGGSRAEQLKRLGIETVEDQLWHLPTRYEEFSGLKKIADLVAGQIQTVKGEVVEIDGKQASSGRTVVSVVLSDGGRVALEGVWFNQPWLAGTFRYGQRQAFTGKAKWFRDHWQMSMPEVQTADDADDGGGSEVLPVYPLTEDLRIEQLRSIARRVVDDYAGCLPERLPGALRQQRQLPDIQKAIRDVHFPERVPDAFNARRRFVYEEFLVLQLALAARRRETRSRQRAPVLPCNEAVDARVRKLLPFALTDDQNIAVREICRDLASDRPMQRLLQADVGAGKTAVADRGAPGLAARPGR